MLTGSVETKSSGSLNTLNSGSTKTSNSLFSDFQAYRKGRKDGGTENENLSFGFEIVAKVEKLNLFSLNESLGDLSNSSLFLLSIYACIGMEYWVNFSSHGPQTT